MDAKRAEKKDGLATEAHNLQIEQRTLHAGYRVEHSGCRWVDTGPLEILRIIRKDNERQLFRGRWDRAENPAKDALDFDLFHHDKTKSKDFKEGKGGWSGHHTVADESDPDTRIFVIKIASPEDGLIFDGTVSFTLTTQKLVSGSVNIGDVLEGSVVKAGRSPT
jgi:hypothetical protein